MRIIKSNVLFFIFLIFFAQFAYDFFIRGDGMKDQVLNEPFKTICVGRLLIDVPKISIVSFMGTYFAGWSVSASLGDKNFNDQLISFERDTSSKKNEKNKPSLEKVIRINDSERNGAIFFYDRRWFDLKEGDRRVVSQVVQVSALIRINGVVYRFKKEFGRDGDEEFLSNMIMGLSYLENGVYPEKEGYCIENGFILGKGRAPYTETTGISISLKDHPDLRMVLSTAGNIKKSELLLVREEKNPIKNKYKWLFSTIRKGGRSIDGMPGEEVVDTVRELNGTHSQDFMWESIGNKDDIYMPVISFELNTGHGREGPVNSSLKDAEALALWEKISSSIRRRPLDPKK